MSFERLEEEMMGECRGRDKYTERIINERKDPAAGQSEAHKLSLRDHRQMSKCGKRGEKLSLLMFMTLEQSRRWWCVEPQVCSDGSLGCECLAAEPPRISAWLSPPDHAASLHVRPKTINMK